MEHIFFIKDALSFEAMEAHRCLKQLARHLLRQGQGRRNTQRNTCSARGLPPPEERSQIRNTLTTARRLYVVSQVPSGGTCPPFFTPEI